MIIQLSQNYNLGGDAKVVIPSGTQMEVNQDLAFTLAREGVATIVSYTPSTIGMTDAQLRATPVPVAISSGIELEFKNDTGNPLPIISYDLSGKPTSPPDYWDVSSATIVYQGWKSGATVILSKTDLSSGTRTWGVDTWANRATATYA